MAEEIKPDEETADVAQTERRARRDERRASQRERRRYRSLFWPILLIGVGALWLLSNLNIISTANLSVLFRLWPLIFIVIGLDLLFGRQSRLLGGLIGLLAVAAVVVLVIVGPALGLVGEETPSFFGLPVALGDVELKHGTFSEPLDGAESAEVMLDLTVGQTMVEALSGSDDLLVADVDYLGTIELDVSGGSDRTVTLREVDVPATLGNLAELGDIRWDVGLSPDVPMDVRVDMGAGPATLDLSGIQVTDFDLDGGAGRLEVNLPATGDAYDAKIDLGVGSTEIDIEDSAQVDLDFDGGAGSVVMVVGDEAVVTLTYDGGAGSFALDVGSDVMLDAELSNGAGSMAVDIPDGASVRLEVENAGTGSLNVPDEFDLVDNGDDDNPRTGVWETRGFEDASRQIEIVVKDMGVGSISVQ